MASAILRPANTLSLTKAVMMVVIPRHIICLLQMKFNMGMAIVRPPLLVSVTSAIPRPTNPLSQMTFNMEKEIVLPPPLSNTTVAVRLLITVTNRVPARVTW
jgi:hypothetical protein